ncbi:MAG TPA: UbiD family decarboxylase [Chloroflexota bacterium]|nr:UbiD family decarboxylase [Chloroflexota bacterium]
MVSPASAATLDLHGFLIQYERDYPDEVVHVERPMDATWELTALAAKLERDKRFPVLIFHDIRVDGLPLDIPLVTFMMASRLRLARLLGSGVPEAGRVCFERVQRRRPPIVVPRAEAPVKQIVETGSAVDVRRFPAPRHHRTDPGRYITEGLFLTRHRSTGLDNSALHRGWLAGRDEIRVWMGPQTHNAHNLRQYEDAGEDMPAAFWIGHHPLVVLGAASHIGPEDSHFAAAGGLAGEPLRLVPSETLGDDFLVPADVEVVIEGYVPAGQRKPEGPFGEYTRYIGPQRWGPFLKVTAVTRRRDAFWSDVMVGHTHWISSLAKEGEIFQAIQRAVPTVRAVHVPMSGAGVAHAYVQIRKTIEGQGKVAALAALNTQGSMKHAFVFDDDVDVFDEKEVLLALAMRFQADRGMVQLSGLTGGPLDPSSEDGRTSAKIGFDCTKPLDRPFAERLAVPADVLGRMDPVAILGRDRLARIPAEPWG